MTSVKMASTARKRCAHCCEKQSKAILAEETQVQLHKNLLAMTKGEERVNVSEAE